MTCRAVIDRPLDVKEPWTYFLECILFWFTNLNITHIVNKIFTSHHLIYICFLIALLSFTVRIDYIWSFCWLEWSPNRFEFVSFHFTYCTQKCKYTDESGNFALWQTMINNMNTSLGICFWARDARIPLKDDPQLYKYCAMVFANQNEEKKEYWKLSEKVKIKLSK